MYYKKEKEADVTGTEKASWVVWEVRSERKGRRLNHAGSVDL